MERSAAEELEEAVRSAAGETDRLTRLAEHLLVLARSDQGPLTLRREPIVAKSLAGKVAGRFAAAGRAIEVEVPDGLGVSGDSVRLEQALGDLVANALEHGSGTVSITGAEEDGQVELHVLDEGPGFSPAFLPRAFERFSRADEARSGGGAGLGLAIVDAIARGHGGSAHAANRPDGGADVWLSLPASYRVERG
jgi:two-component system, OmpR family, sensor kinase